MKWARRGRRSLSFILTFLLIISLLATVAASAAVIVSGGKGYVNMQQYCNEGASSSSSSSNSKTYIYNTLSGGRTYLRMMYLSDSNAAGAAKRTDSNGNVIWAYCIEFGTAIESYNARTAGSLTSSTVWKNLSTNQQQGITLACMYGCPVNKLGTTVADAYAATQVLIWEYQTGIRNSLTSDTRQAVTYRGTKLSKTYFTSMLSGKAGMTAYNALVTKVLAHKTTPSFAGSTITLAYNTSTKKYQKVLTDTKGVLADYNLSVNNSAVSITRSGNTLTLASSKPVSGVTLTMKRKTPTLTGQGFLALKASSGQSTIVGQTTSSVTATATIKSAVGNLKITKTSTDKVVSGVKFTVTGQGLTKTVTTDSSGVASLTNLPAGTYTVAETTGDQYVAVSNQKVTVTTGKTASVSFHNVLKTGSVVLTKVDADTGSGISGVVFGLYESDGTLLKKYTTGTGGVLTVEELSYGSYYLQELEPVSGYLLSTEKFSFDVKEQQQTVTFTAKNSSEKYKISVYKQGEQLTGFTSEDGTCYTPVYENQYLSGCEVEIIAAEDVVTGDGTRQYQAGDVVDTLITSSEGPVSTKELYKGTYLVHEVTAPDGYVAADKDMSVNLFEGDQTVTVTDSRIHGSLTFQKKMVSAAEQKAGETVAADKASSLYSSICFGVYSAEGILDLPADTLLDRITPDENGNCTMNVDLPYGYHYYLKELSTADHYVLDEATYEFSVQSGDPIVINNGEALTNLEELPPEPETTTTITTTQPSTTTTVTPTTTTATTKKTVVDTPNTDDPTRLLPSVLGVVIGLGGLAILRHLNRRED